MKRYAINKLIAWKESQNRKPLIIRGARQVGKTWLMKELYEKAVCQKAYKEYKNGCHAEDLFLHFEDDFTKLCIEWLT